MNELLSLLSTIESPDIRSKTEEFLRTKTPDYFWIVPASSSGKYHPPYTLGEGGLLRHTIAALKIMNHMLNLEYLQKKFTVCQRDKMRAAVILHDTRKHGEAEGHTVEKHEVLAADAFNEFLGVQSSDIGQLIRCHMGQWSVDQNDYPQTTAEFLVHLVDYLASRKDIEVSM